MRKWIIMVLPLLLLGCTRIDQTQPGRPKVVTGITASYIDAHMTLHRTYTDPDKIRAVLTYLRGLEPYGSAEADPTTQPGGRGAIRVTFSDGSAKEYNQWADRYLQVDGGPWQAIAPEQGREFPLLLGLMESDPLSG